MTTTRPAEENDFRAPEYRFAKLEDYEVRLNDGKAVRKDRWENAVRHFAIALGFGREFEIDAVVDKFDTHLHQSRKAVLEEVLSKIGDLIAQQDKTDGQEVLDLVLEMKEDTP